MIGIVVPSDAQRYLEMIESGTYSVAEIQLEAERHFEGRDKGRGSGYKQYKRWEYNALINSDADGMLPSPHEIYSRSLKQEQSLNQSLFAMDESCVGDWQELGPLSMELSAGYNPGVGRVTSIAVDANDDQHIIVGAQTGGVWKTMDGGQSWTSLTDQLSSIEVYSLAIDPGDGDTYYWGGADGFLLVSRDGGRTWSDLSVPARGLIVQIKVHPRTGSLWAASTGTGLYRYSPDSESWEAKVFDNCYDLEFHPTADSVIYASGTGMWVSTDDGDLFNPVAGGDLISGVAMMSVSSQAPDHVYVAETDGNSFGALYVSRDRGETFEVLQDGTLNYFGYSTDGTEQGGQAPRDMDIVVSDVDTNVIFLAGINVWRSMDGGRQFEIVSDWFLTDNPPYAYCHADVDIMIWHDGAVYIGSDGGIFVMEAPSGEIHADAIRDISAGLGIHQFYRIGVRQSEETIVSGGAQDNGSSILKGGTWHHWMGADGMETFFVELDGGSLMFGTTQFGGLVASTDLGESRYSLLGLSDLQGTGGWITPFMTDAEDEHVYVVYDAVYRSDDFGSTFTQISQSQIFPELLAIAPSGSDTMYAQAFFDFYRTMDGGATDWESLIDISNFDGIVQRIAVHPKNARMVAVSFDIGTKVAISNNGGETWQAYDVGLPEDFPARALVWDDDDDETLYVGMNYGIYKRSKSDDRWMPFSFGLPNVIINDLEINHVTDEIFAGTYGRGLWVSPLCDESVDTERPVVKANPELRSSLIRQGDRVEIELAEHLHADILVYRMDGQAIYYDPSVDMRDRYFINTDGWSAGLYILRLETSSGFRVFKVVIQ